MEVVRHSKFDISKLSYTKPTNQQNLYYGAMHYEDKLCYIQTSKLIVSEIKEINKQLHLVAHVEAGDFSFYDTLVTLDDHNLSATYKSSKEWFQKELPMDILEGMYRRISKPFKKGDVPLIELKIPVTKQCVQSKVYDHKNQPIDIKDIQKGSAIMCIMHIKGLKFLKKDYYCDNYITQIKVLEPSPIVGNDVCLIEDDMPHDMTYDYEIVDEEVVHQNKEKLELEGKYNILTQSIETMEGTLTEEKHSLAQLRKKIDNLT